MPTRYRQDVMDCCSGQMMMTVDRDKCLLLYPMPEWEVIEQKLAALPNVDDDTRILQRLLVGYATPIEMDAQGRMLVPPPLREFAAFDKRVMMLGQINKFELWSEARWMEKTESWLSGRDGNGGRSSALDSLSL